MGGWGGGREAGRAICFMLPGLKYPRGEELRMNHRGRRWWWKRSGVARKLGVVYEKGLVVDRVGERERAEKRQRETCRWESRADGKHVKVPVCCYLNSMESVCMCCGQLGSLLGRDDALWWRWEEEGGQVNTCTCILLTASLLTGILSDPLGLYLKQPFKQGQGKV